MLKNKKIVFLTGTRADFGKIKSLIVELKNSDKFDIFIFVTGMHLNPKYGYTVNEVTALGIGQIYKYSNQFDGEPMESVLANTVRGLSQFFNQINPDCVVVHGDRLEALAGAIVGSFRNTFVAHIEGGEVSGTIDETIRHAVTKLSHTHFVSNEQARDLLVQLGEDPKSIYIIGSPDIDLMMSQNLPSIEQVKDYYNIVFDKYHIVMLHPVTTELKNNPKNAKILFDALANTDDNYIIIYPNNDPGSEDIIREINKLRDEENFQVFPSIRFEFFLTLLKSALSIIGNSSAGIREAPIYNVPSINIGSRQNGRQSPKSVIHIEFDTNLIISTVETIHDKENEISTDRTYGIGNSSKMFVKAISSRSFWDKSVQKQIVRL